MTTNRIEIDPNVMMGKPVIRGTRIKVELLLRKLAEGATEDELLDAYPRLTREDIRAPRSPREQHNFSESLQRDRGGVATACVAPLRRSP